MANEKGGTVDAGVADGLHELELPLGSQTTVDPYTAFENAGDNRVEDKAPVIPAVTPPAAGAVVDPATPPAGATGALASADVDPWANISPALAADPMFIKAREMADELSVWKKDILPSFEAITAIVRTPEDAKHLQEQAGYATSLVQAMEKSPIDLARSWQRAYPQSWDQMYAAIHQGLHAQSYGPVLTQAVEMLEKAGLTEDATKLKASIEAALPRTGAETSRESESVRVERERLGEDRASFNADRFNGFHSSATSGIETDLLASITPVFDKATFATPALKNQAVTAVFEAIKGELDGDAAFQSRMTNLWNAARNGNTTNPQHQAIVEAYTNRVQAMGGLKRIMGKVMADFGAQVMAKSAAVVAIDQNAGARREAAGGGQGASGGNGAAPNLGTYLSEGSQRGLRGGELYDYAQDRLAEARAALPVA